MAAIHLSNPVKDLYGVGPAAEEKLAKLDIYTIYDLIAFIPWRYDDWSHVGTIGSFDMNDRFADNTWDLLKLGGKNTCVSTSHFSLVQEFCHNNA